MSPAHVDVDVDPLLTEMNPPTQSLQDLDIPCRTAPVIPIIPGPLLSLLLALDLHALGDLGYDFLDVKL